MEKDKKRNILAEIEAESRSKAIIMLEKVKKRDEAVLNADTMSEYVYAHKANGLVRKLFTKCA